MFSKRLRSLSSTPTYPPAPDGLVIYAIGDIHGQQDLLVEVQAAIDADAAHHDGQQIVEIYLGDYIDRGPCSREVLDNLAARMNTAAPDRTFIALKGNHEAVFLDFLNGDISLDAWIAFGGWATLNSYGLTSESMDEASVRRDLDAGLGDRRVFLENLQNYVIFGDYLFVHAGVRPGIPLDRQDEDAFLWIRTPFLTYQGSFGHIVVHGHTPVAAAEFHVNRIDIDSGVCFTGKLTCLKIDASGPHVLGEGAPS